MTTAELIKKKEEEKNNPPQQTTLPTFKPTEGMNMAEARMAGNNMPQDETSTSTATAEQSGNPYVGKSMAEARMLGGNESGVSLYDDGVNSGNKTTISGSPINTPEYQKMREQLIKPEDFGLETEEQRKKRERADFIKKALTGFTEGLSALANLYYTTKGAPSQKLTSQMPELSKRLYAERLERDKKLENFRAWQRAKADKEEERAYNLNLLEAANKAAEKKAKLDAQAAEIKYLRDLGLIDARKAADLEKQKGKASLDQELESIRQKNRVSLAGINNQAAMERAAARGGGTNATIRVPIGNDGEYAEYRKNDLTNPIVISQIYNSLPDDYRVRGKEKSWNQETKSMEYPYDENPSTQKMQEAIGKALSDGYLTEMATEIQVGRRKKDTQSKKDEDNTPPSRRKNKDEDNIPPSKRNK